MPTGYTAKLIENGQSFNEFVMLCARNFGACITMRDEPLGAEIPEKFDYNDKRLKKNKAKLQKLKSMSDEEKFEYGNKLKSDRISSLREIIQKCEEENKRIDDMLRQVKSWVPPTEDHYGLKNFMVQQLNVSRNEPHFYKKELVEAEKKSEMQYYTDDLELIKYHTAESQKESTRTNGRNVWIKRLRESLK